MAGATVRARSETTGAVRSATTDARGQFQFNSLPPGLWVVAASLPDGASSDSRTVALALQEARSVDLTLGKGLAERVTVRAEPLLVDPQRVGLEMRVGDSIADAIPIAGRVVTDLPLLDASVRQAPTADFFGERGAVFVVNGQSGRSNSFLVDGLDNNDETSGTSMNSFFSQLVVQEMVLNTSRYAAEFGRASGGVFNIVTRQGGNEESGEFFVQRGAASWNSPGAFVSGLPDPKGTPRTGDQYQLGFRVGGPIREDRAFYFAAYERQREDRVVPYVGTGRNGAAGGFVIAPAADDNIFLRTDFNLSPSQSLMVRLSADTRSTEDLNVGGRTTPEAGFRLDEHDLQLAGSLTSVLSPNLIHEARLLVSSSDFDQQANSSRPGVDRPSGSFGGNNLNRQLRREDKFQVVDNVTWRVGSHTTKFGLDFTRSRTDVRTRFNPNGNFLYATDTPYDPNSCPVSPSQVTAAIRNGTYPIIPCQPWEIGKDRADIGTYPIVYQLIEGEPEANLYDNQIGLFAQDTWRLGSKVVLEYGLRYDLDTFRLPPSARVDSPIPNGGAPLDKNNVAPRLGFTFTPGDGRLVLRGGGGVFYDKLSLGFPAVAAITSETRIGILPVQGMTLEVPVGDKTVALTEDAVEQLGGGSYLKDFLVFPDDLILRFSTGTRLDTPYSFESSVGAEIAVGKGGAAQLEIVRARGHHLPLMRDLNPIVRFRSCSGPSPTDPDPKYRDSCTPVHADSTTGSIAAITTDGESWYTGATLGWRWRGKMGWYQASYTWSRAEDLGPDPLKGGIYLPPDSANLSGEKGPSDADRRHRIVISGESSLPWMGLRASGVIQVSSPVPFNVTTGRDDNLDGITTDRPPGVGRNTGEDTPLGPVNEVRASENQLRRIRSQPLLAPVTSLYAPAFYQIDLRVSKPFATRDGKTRGEMYLQIFNLLDRLNGGPVEGRAISPDFGKPIDLAGPPRTMELGLRLGY
jgi:hypothetical protein